ncbi:hypothetical protein N7481_007286 [Penicillium waksmanii]|uniref:uncharacterized protein n=1 Tax=Penicillium waksmanii TaxID=69791 RepID=UPI00254912F8|nr:uncharacterized protein N7481_007286 [Penicillium waksmanii]KAJ5979988.1 hypothetical protein N7481_007286 [Penicillium waksmanii]
MYNHSFRSLIKALPVSQADVDFFSEMPFAHPFLKPSSPYQIVPFITRYDKGDLSDMFFNKTINTCDTISRVLAFMRKPVSLQGPAYDNEGIDPLKYPDEPHFVAFFQLETGVNGFINTAHGGLLASLLDETLGICVETYRMLASEELASLLTGELQVSYRSPVPIPSAIMIKSWVRRKEGRKWFLEARVLDQNGLLKAEAKSLYIMPRSAI